jgi:hypothetical protein
MSQKINLGRQGFIAPLYKNAIDTSFTQLQPPPPPVEEVFTVEQFFKLYSQLFYEIPSEGSINSHQVLINRSSEYIGFSEEHEQDIQILLDEITQLREQLLATQKELTNTQNNNVLNLDSNVILEGTEITENPGSVGSVNVIN